MPDNNYPRLYRDDDPARRRDNAIGRSREESELEQTSIPSPQGLGSGIEGHGDAHAPQQQGFLEEAAGVVDQQVESVT